MEQPDHINDAICRVQEHRGWILSSYAQIEYLFSDLVSRATGLEEYQLLGDALPFQVSKRLKRARKILDSDGPLRTCADDLRNILDQFEEREEIRNILAHGFITVYHDPAGQMQFEFRKWHWPEEGDYGELVHRCFEVNLDYEAHQLRRLADEASNKFRVIHQELGWGG